MSERVLRANGLTRRFGPLVALHPFDCEVSEGETLALLGPNGAGKSTTIKILSGILVPDSGRCEVLGHVPWRERAVFVGRIGVVFGQRTQLWWDLPVAESFDLLRAIYRVPEAEHRANRDELIAMLDLEPLLDTPVRQLSLGQRMRCDVAAALLHAPPLPRCLSGKIRVSTATALVAAASAGADAESVPWA